MPKIKTILEEFDYYHGKAKTTDNLGKMIRYLAGDNADDFMDKLAAQIKQAYGDCVPVEKCEDKSYHYICYAGSVVRLVDSWGNKETIKCENKTRYGQGDWGKSYACTDCKGELKGDKEITQYCKSHCVPYNACRTETLARMGEING